MGEDRNPAYTAWRSPAKRWARTLFLQAGLRDVVAFPKTLVLRELDVADRIYCFIATVERLADAGVVGLDAAGRWSQELRAADVEGRFFTSYPASSCAGRDRIFHPGS